MAIVIPAHCEFCNKNTTADKTPIFRAPCRRCDRPVEACKVDLKKHSGFCPKCVKVKAATKAEVG